MIAKKNQKAFTLIETLFVVAVFAILILLTVPFSFDFYWRHQLDVFSEELVQNLRRAQLKSMSGEQDSNFGVYLGQNNYTLFKGSSWENREEELDEIFDLPENLSLEGVSEIVFSKIQGNPSVEGSITLNSNISSKTIFINSLGRINLEY